MSATDELRKMLDERGVEWGEPPMKPYKTWFPDSNGVNCCALPWGDALVIKRFSLTPAQAISATLGRGECELIKHGSLANWPEMVCWSCSACGFGWHHSINDKQFSYCPNCGSKVVNS